MSSPLLRPSRGTGSELEITHEDLVDTRDRRREPGQTRLPDVEIPEHEGRPGRQEPCKSLLLEARQARMLRGMEVRRDEATAARPHRHHLCHAPILSPIDAHSPPEGLGAPQLGRVQPNHSVRSRRGEIRSEEEHVRLADEGRAKAARVELGEAAGERPGERRHGDSGGGAHPAPLRNLTERPDRDFLKPDERRAVFGDEPYHPLELEPASLRNRPAVKEVPRAHEESHGREYCRPVSGRFADLVERQLDLFAADNAELLADTEAALHAYDRAPREDAEERYGDFVDLADTGALLLVELRDAYAETLDGETADEYREAFDRRARKRLPRFGLELD